MEQVVFEALVYIGTFLIGLIAGGYVTAVIYRMPTEEKLMTAKFHCTKCSEGLKWYECVPLASYIIQRGRCKHCGAKISAQYPLIELISGAGYVLILFVNGFNLLSVIFCLCFSVLLVITVIDWQTFEIYDVTIKALFILGICRTAIDYHNFLAYVIGFFAVSGILFLIYFLSHERAMGFGDVKLMAVAGLILGWKLVLVALVVGAILGCIIHYMLMLVLKKERMLAFGPYLAAGIFIAMLWGNKLIDWYVGLFWK